MSSNFLTVFSCSSKETSVPSLCPSDECKVHRMIHHEQELENVLLLPLFLPSFKMLWAHVHSRAQIQAGPPYPKQTTLLVPPITFSLSVYQVNSSGHTQPGCERQVATAPLPHTQPSLPTEAAPTSIHLPSSPDLTLPKRLS